MSAIKAQLSVRMESRQLWASQRSTGPTVIKSTHAVVPASSPNPLPFNLSHWPLGSISPILPACFSLFFSFLSWTNPLAVPASFVEFSLTDPFHRLFMICLSGFTADGWNCAQVFEWACKQFLHLLKQQFTPKTALHDTMTDVGFSRKTEL